eukprot:COSAG01_NODE_758_length_13805_cov_23.267912_13_plen_69_part_00
MPLVRIQSRTTAMYRRLTPWSAHVANFDTDRILPVPMIGTVALLGSLTFSVFVICAPVSSGVSSYCMG